jgi:hypothetical protein
LRLMMVNMAVSWSGLVTSALLRGWCWDTPGASRVTPGGEVAGELHRNTGGIGAWLGIACFYGAVRPANFGTMSDSDATLVGVIRNWPSKSGMESILRDAGLGVRSGKYSIHIEDCSHFVFQQYGGDIGQPVIDADAESVARMLKDGERVSTALSNAEVEHRFEVYNSNNELVAVLGWPRSS